MIAEKSERRCDALKAALQERAAVFGIKQGKSGEWVHSSGDATGDVAHYGERVEEAPKLFAAMPFSEELADEWEIGILESATASGLTCERIDLEHFVGDIFLEIKKRIHQCQGVIALMNGHNPNVFLEIGFAIALGKPVVFVLKQGMTIPFDVRGQKCIFYKSIVELRKRLKEEIASLKEQGVFGSP